MEYILRTMLLNTKNIFLCFVTHYGSLLFFCGCDNIGGDFFRESKSVTFSDTLPYPRVYEYNRKDSKGISKEYRYIEEIGQGKRKMTNFNGNFEEVFSSIDSTSIFGTYLIDISFPGLITHFHQSKPVLIERFEKVGKTYTISDMIYDPEHDRKLSYYWIEKVDSIGKNSATGARTEVTSGRLVREYFNIQQLFSEEVIQTISWYEEGIGLRREIKNFPDHQIIITFVKAIPVEEFERRKRLIHN